MTSLELARRARIIASPVIFRGGFRLLFLGGAVWALVVVALWVASLTGAITLPTAMDPLAWHQHEMLFGYLSAIIAGFLTAAIPNWTGRPALAGWPVAGFVSLWLAARLAILFSSVVPPIVGAVLDLSFLLALCLYAAQEIFGAKNRNKPILIVILLFALASGLDHAAAMGAPVADGLGMRAGFALVLVLIAIIGGRIIPAFTRNWLTRMGRTERLPAQTNLFDKVAIGVMSVALASWTIMPGSQAAALLLLLAGVLHLVRLARWAGLSAAADPLVFILHISYAWLPLGLLLLGASIVSAVLPVSAAMHALAAGAMASMTLAVMTRATRGHTGRPLESDRATVLIYVLVTLGALLRVAAPLLPIDYMLSIRIAGGLWGGAFLLFALSYGPMLLGPRADGKP